MTVIKAQPQVTSFAPQFLVDDLVRSIAYYQKLGFAFGEPWDGFYAIGRVNGLELHLKEAPKSEEARRHLREHEHLDAAAGVDGIEVFYAQCAANGVRIIKALAATEWGTKDFYVEDPDGYVVCYGGRQAPPQHIPALVATRRPDVPMIPELPGAVPELPVSDITAATRYYRDSLSFSIDWVAEDIALAGISRDNCRLFLAGPPFRQERGNASPVLTWLNLGSKADVDGLHEAWRATNAILLSAPESKSWGLHEFTAADADGNLIRVFHDFATPERERATPASRGGR